MLNKRPCGHFRGFSLRRYGGDEWMSANTGMQRGLEFLVVDC